MTKKLFLLSAMSFALVSCLKTAEDPVPTDLASQMPTDHPPVTTPGTEEKSLLAQGNMPMGSRYFVASVFRSIFTDPNSMTSAQIKAFNDILDRNVLKYPSEFGGAVSLYSTRGLKENIDAYGTFLTAMTNENDMEVPMQMTGTPARALILRNTCSAVLDNFFYFKEGLRKVGVTFDGSNAPAFDSSKTQAIYELFYMGDTAPDGMDQSLQAIADEAKFKGLSSADQWRAVYYSICESQYWQLL